MLEEFSLKGKNGIVTGGGTGLGKAMATALVRAGAGILIVGRRMDVLEATARELSGTGGTVIPMAADVTAMNAIPKIIDRVVREFGRTDFLFNNAGVSRRAPCEDYTEEDWDVVIQTNLKAPFFMAQAVARQMIGSKTGGVIVNTSSAAGFMGGNNIPAYAASKAALSHLTKSLAKAWARYDIRVNAIAPGFIKTQINQGLWKDPERSREVLARIPMGRWGTLEEVGGAAVFLASSASSYMTGHTLLLDGGMLSF
jgi:2-deoxy-D-gluconate 3-dehydrogenase